MVKLHSPLLNSILYLSPHVALERIVSKRLGSRYRSGRPRDWLKMKNPAAPAVKREAEEEWGQMTRRKFEITGHMNERDFPHIVELERPPGGFRNRAGV